MNTFSYDEEEKELIESFNRGEWKSISSLEDEIIRHRQIAANTLKKNKRVNIRMSSKDLDELKTIAMENGLPYQTLISSILHKYISGRLTEKTG